MTAYDFRPGALCDIDAQPVRGHQRCSGCLILTGSGHYDQRLRNGLCQMCSERKTLKAIEVTDAIASNLEAMHREDYAFMLYVERGMSLTQVAREMRTMPRLARELVYRAKQRRHSV